MLAKGILLLSACFAFVFCSPRHTVCPNDTTYIDTTQETNNANIDSLLIVNGEWLIDSLDGFVLKRVQFDNKECLGSNQYVCILEIAPESPRRLAFTYEPRRTPTSTHAKRNNAIAAINGSFFDMKYHNPICYLRIDGKEKGINTPQKSDSINRKYYQYGSMKLEKGRPVFFIPDSGRFAERLLADSNIMTAGPLLIYHGKLIPMRDDKEFVTNRHNRTAIGTKKDGTVLLVTIDGRMKLSEGMSLMDFQKLLYYLGCEDALNLDGGGSTTMYVKGFEHSGIVNHPTDNGKYDFKGERDVSNCVIIK
ncbi:MAG: phosphodiester glycosidase family protein [Bacteroidales bacterium]|nr:phosphodiester glycosidase family protein [Bacteroidales bacterium]